MKNTIAALCATIALTCLPARAYSPVFEQGRATYESGQYAQALAQFQQENQINPTDALNHYYMGLCFHHMQRLPEATAEYNWVLLHSQDTELIKRVQAGLQVMSKYQPVPPGNAGKAPAAKAPAPPAPAKTSPPIVTAAPGGIGKIFNIYVTWSPYCKNFNPIFLRSLKKYKPQGLQFQMINAEEGTNKQELARFGLKGYPTILFFDSHGNLIDRIDGAPRTFEDFEVSLLHSYPSIKPF
jgi:tetratricopeptide (TPR) repeat protein